MLRHLLIVLLALGAIPSAAHAWGKDGHRIVCEIAFQELRSQQARQAIIHFIAADPGYSRFSESCLWPDNPRRRQPEHFINLPRYYFFVGSSQCPLAEKCLFTAIADDLESLGSASTPQQEKLEALKFLGHWVGDIHQPLHVSFQDDRGGNLIKEQGGPCDGKLHGVWDTCMPKRLGANAGAIAADLQGDITDAERDGWRAASIATWADESFKIALDPDVDYCEKHGRVCWYGPNRITYQEGEPERRVTVDQAYLDAHLPIVAERLKQAGVRLAMLLDRALGP